MGTGYSYDKINERNRMGVNDENNTVVVFNMETKLVVLGVEKDRERSSGIEPERWESWGALVRETLVK